jgi:hypothetical protein
MNKIWQKLPNDIIKYISKYDNRIKIIKDKIFIVEIFEDILNYEKINLTKKLEFCYKRQFNLIKKYKYFYNIYIKLIFREKINKFIIDKCLPKVIFISKYTYLEINKFEHYKYIDEKNIIIYLPIPILIHCQKNFELIYYLDKINYNIEQTICQIRFFN